MPRASPSRAHSAAASLRRRGRSSRPTSVANVASAGPPLARRRRAVSCSATAEGNVSLAAAWTTTSTQPFAVGSYVGGQQHRATWSDQRQPDVRGAHDLGSKLTKGLSDLGAEHRAAHLPHHTKQRSSHRLHLGGYGRGRCLDNVLRDG